MRNILIAGATSAIAQETAKHFAQDGDNLFLVARNPEKLQAVADDLRARGAGKVATFNMDMNAVDRHEEMWRSAETAIGAVDTLLVAYGVLPNQEACSQDVQRTLDTFQTNAVSVIALLTMVANIFAERREGSIAVISSVAGDRGRRSNYIYGASKGALNIFLQGLRNRLYRSHVHVLTIKPGMVDTPMTAHMRKGPLFADPKPVGERIYRAIVNKEDTIYVPWFWRWVMIAIKAIPESVFKRLSL